jgi:hypothetical protein
MFAPKKGSLPSSPLQVARVSNGVEEILTRNIRRSKGKHPPETPRKSVDLFIPD